MHACNEFVWPIILKLLDYYKKMLKTEEGGGTNAFRSAAKESWKGD